MLFLLQTESFKKRVKNVLPFLAGTAVFLIWPIWVIIQSPTAFYLNAFRIPQLNSEYSRQMEIVRSKVNLTIISLTEPGYFLLFVAAIFLVITIYILRRRLMITDGRKAILAVLLSTAFFVIAYIPPSVWFQYFGVPLAIKNEYRQFKSNQKLVIWIRLNDYFRNIVAFGPDYSVDLDFQLALQKFSAPLTQLCTTHFGVISSLYHSIIPYIRQKKQLLFHCPRWCKGKNNCRRWEKIVDVSQKQTVFETKESEYLFFRILRLKNGQR